MSGPSGPNVPDDNILAAGRALEVISLILADEGFRNRYHDAPEDVFNEARLTSDDEKVKAVEYSAVPDATRAVLESMAVEELTALERFGAGLITDGMYFDVPGVGRCYIK